MNEMNQNHKQMTQLIFNPRFEQSMISLFQREKCEDTIAASYLWDISYEILHELGTIKEEVDENSCPTKLDDAYFGMSFPNHVFDRDATIMGVGACEDTVILASTSILVEPSNEEFSSMHAIVDVCFDDSTLVIADEVGDIVTKSCYTINQQSVDVHFMDSTMFDMEARFSYDNLMFEVDVDHSLEWSWAQFSPSIKTHFCLAGVGNVPMSTDFDVATPIVDTVSMSAYGSPIATSLQGIVDQDSSLVYIIWVGTRMKIFLVGFSFGDILTPTSLAQVLSAILHRF
jgi:hypothetical protein